MLGETPRPPETKFAGFRENARRFGEEHRQLEARLQDVLSRIEKENDPNSFRGLREEWERIAKASEEALLKERDWLESAEFLSEESKRAEAKS